MPWLATSRNHFHWAELNFVCIPWLLYTEDLFYWAGLNFVCLGWLYWETSFTGQNWTLPWLATLRDKFHWAELNFVCLGWLHWETSFTGQNWTLLWLATLRLGDRFHWAELNFVSLVGYTSLHERPVSLGRTELCLPWLAIHWETSFTGQNWTLPWLATLRDWFHWAGLNFVCVGWLYTERRFTGQNWTLSALVGYTLRNQFHWAELNFVCLGWLYTERPVSLGRTELCLGWLHCKTGFTGQDWTLSALVGYTLRDQFHWAGLNFAWLHWETSFTVQTELCLPWLATHERPVSLGRTELCLPWLTTLPDQFHWAE